MAGRKSTNKKETKNWPYSKCCETFKSKTFNFCYVLNINNVEYFIITIRIDHNKWAATWQNQQSECVPSEDSDQPGHPLSLIRVFAVRMKKAWILSYPLSAQRRLWSYWAGTHFVGFVMSRLILSQRRLTAALILSVSRCHKFIKSVSFVSFVCLIRGISRLFKIISWIQNVGRGRKFSETWTWPCKLFFLTTTQIQKVAKQYYTELLLIYNDVTHL